MNSTPHAQRLLFCTEPYQQLAVELCPLLDAQLGQVERRVFPDGERYQRLLDEVIGRDVVLLGGTLDDSQTLALFDLGCAIAKYGAHTLTVVVPFFGYSTMERATKSGEIVTAKTRARLLSAIPIAGSGNRIVLFDLHAETITHYFEGAMRQAHVSGYPLAERLIRQLSPDASQTVVACTDAGRAKWVEHLANRMSVPAAFVLKKRFDDGHTELLAVSAQVEGKQVVIYDDMIRTGGSLLKAAAAYRQAGAKDVHAVCTHGVFPGDALQRIQASGLISSIAASNSHPRAVELQAQGLRLQTCAPLLAQAVRCEGVSS